jgi:sugar lactone lactonase YvrE
MLLWAGLAGGTQPFDTYQSTIAGDSPVAQYRLSDTLGSGTLADSAGTNTATNHGVTLGGSGPFGGSASGLFDGEGAYASLGSNPLAGANAFTAEAWIKWVGGASYEQPIFEFGSSSTSYLYLTPASGLSGHRMLFEIHPTEGSSTQVSAPELEAESWQYVAVTETSGGTATLYVNGQQVGQAEGQPLSPSSLGSLADDYLGESLTGAPPFDGSLSNVAFYSTALTAGQIKSHYDDGEFPVNTAVPTISGTPQDEGEVTAHAESWTGLEPIVFGYQWLRCTAPAVCTSISGGVEQTYEPKHSDVGDKLEVEVEGVNDSGSGTATSAESASVLALKPANTSPPTISGTAQAGQTLTASAGSWTGTPTITYAYQWQRCDESGESCSAISGETSSSYELAAEDVGATICVHVTATGPTDSDSASSDATATVIAEVAPGPVYALGFDSEGSTGGELESPGAVALAPNGDLTVLDAEAAHVREFTTKGEFVRQFGSEGSGEGQLSRPDALAVDPEGNIWVLDSGNSRAEEFTEGGVFIRTAGGPGSGPGELENPEGLTVSDGHVWVADTYHGHLVEFDASDGAYLATIDTHGSGAGELGEPEGLAADASGNIWVADWANSKVLEFSGEGEYLQEFGTSGSEDGQLEGPYGIAVDATGGVWVGDTGNSRLEQFSGTGEYESQLGSAGGELGQLTLTLPMGVAVDALGNIWVADSGNGRLEQWRQGSPVAPANVAAPKVYGGSVAGETLNASSGSWEGTPPLAFSYQWKRCNSVGEACSDISEATAQSYALTEADVGHTLIAAVVVTGELGSAEAHSSAPSDVVVAPTPPSNVTAPTITGEAHDEATLVAEPGEWEGNPAPTFAYQWQHCDEGGGECEDISEATGSEYTIGHSEVGGTIRVLVTAENASGSASSASEVTSTVALQAPSNTAAPAIGGEAIEGHTLTAAAGEWAGTPPFEYAYQWESCDALGESCLAIPGAQSETYVLTPADVGATIRVHVTAENAAGSESALSATTAIVGIAPPANEVAPAISGTAQDELALSADLGTWSGVGSISYAYQWQLCNASGGGCADIDGATNSTVPLGHALVGHTVRAVVTATNAGGSTSTQSAPSEEITAASPVNSAVPSISGKAGDGEVLRAADGQWAGTPPISFSYQWVRCNAAGVSCNNISGATSTTYTLSSEDVSDTVRVDVTAANEAEESSAHSATTPVVAAEAPAKISAPTISGSPSDGATLTASPGSWSGEPTAYEYQWYRCNEAGSGCSRIVGATSSSFLLTSAEVGKTVKVEVRASNGAGASSATSAASEVVAASAPSISVAPSLSGPAVVGGTLELDAGTWVGTSPLSFEYQWQSCDAAGAECSDVEGATSREYTVEPGDRGRTLRALVTVTNSVESVSATTTPSAVVTMGLTFVQSFGSLGPIDGQFEDPSGVAFDPEGHMWVADRGDGRIQELDHEGEAIGQCTACAETLHGWSGIAFDAHGNLWAVDPVDDQLVKVNGGGALEAFSSSGSGAGELLDPEAVAVDSEGDVWVTDTGNNRIVVFDDEGNYLKTVGSEGSGAGEFDQPRGIAVGANDTMFVSDSGNHRVETFDDDGSYQGEFGAAGEGPGQFDEPDTVAADGAGHVFVSDLVTSRIEEFGEGGQYVAEIGSDGSDPGQLELASPMGVALDASGDVWVTDPGNERLDEWAPLVAPSNEAPPEITGAEQDGASLSASSGSWLGTPQPDYSYAWERCQVNGGSCEEIAGATGSEYTLAYAELGKAVQVTVTANNAAGSASASSSLTSVIAAGPPLNTVAPSITGQPREGSALVASAGAWAGAPTPTYTYQWQRCNAGGTACTDIPGADVATYTLGASDLGATLRVRTTATNAARSSSANSALTALVTPVREAASHVGSSGAGSAELSRPGDVAVGAEGDLWVVDTGNNRLEHFGSSGEYLGQFGVSGSGEGQLDGPSSVALDGSGHLWVADTANNRVEEFDAAGEHMSTVGAEGSGTGELHGPEGIAIDGNGHIWVSDTERGRLVVFDASGSYLEAVGAEGTGSGQLKTPRGIAVDSTGGVWVADAGNDKVVEFDEEGSYVRQFGSSGSEAGRLDRPSGIAVEQSGNILVGDVGNSRVEEFTSTGSFLGEFGSNGSSVDQLSPEAPMGIAVSPAGDDVWIADAGNDRIDRWTPASAPSNTELPTLTGAARDGQTLAATRGAWDGPEPVSLAYQWQSCSSSGRECADLDGATGPTYTLTSEQVEATIRVLVTASGPGGEAHAASEPSAVVEGGAPSELEAPTVSGEAREGFSLYAEAGSWAGDEAEVSYQWERCDDEGSECSEVEGATEAEYGIVGEGLGATLRVRVGVSNASGSVTALSPPTAPVGGESFSLVNTWPPSVAGELRDGATVHANAGSWTAAGVIGYGFQWRRCDLYGRGCVDVPGAAGTSYVLGSGDVGKTLELLIDASTGESEEDTVVEASSPTVPISPAAGPQIEVPPNVSGTGLVGSTLAATAGAWTAAGPVSVSFQWERCDEAGSPCSPISGATGALYTATESDAGSSVRAIVSATTGGVTSQAPTPSLIVSSDGATRLTSPTVSGSDQVGATLSVESGIWTGEGALELAYQWERCNEECADLEGQTRSDYLLSEADSAQTLRVHVTGTTGSGSADGYSKPTSPISSEVAPPENVSEPAIEGYLDVGDTLTAAPGEWSGAEPISYAYQWERCDAEGEECQQIEGATEARYVLGEEDLEARIVVTVVATTAGGEASASSSPSESVGAGGSPSSSRGPSVLGTPIEGETLTADNGSWLGADPLTFRYVWDRCDAEGESCVAITGATEPKYVPTAEDLGARLRVEVTATNSLGSEAERSEATTAVASETLASGASAVEATETADPSLLAPSSTIDVEGEQVGPELTDPGEELKSQSTLASSIVSKVTPGEFSVETAVGALQVTPLGAAADAATMPTLVNGAAAVFAGTWHDTDAIVRSAALGSTTLVQLRSNDAPMSFSWEVNIGPGQKLERLSDGNVAVTRPAPAGSFEGPLTEEGPEAPEPEPTEPSESGEGSGVSASEEGLEESLADEEGLTPLAPAPTSTTGPTTLREGELHPQDTQASYEKASEALAEAETETADTTLMVIQAPTVLDADGNVVPASLSVEGQTVTMSLSPESGAEYPITAEMPSSAPSDLVSIARDPVTYGLSDPKASVFASLDPALNAKPLEIKVARDVIPYYTNVKADTGFVDWLKAVQTHEGLLKPFVTLDTARSAYCRSDKHPCLEPSIASYKKHFSEILKEIKELHEAEPTVVPEVHLWGAWNEPDYERIVKKPTKKSPKEIIEYNPLQKDAPRAALFWKIARTLCGCQVMAGEFAAFHAKYISKYDNTLVHDHQYTSAKPGYFGLHDYKDVVYAFEHHRGNPKLELFNRPAEAAFVKTMKGQIGEPRLWLTEQGVELADGTKQTVINNPAKKPAIAVVNLKRQREAANAFLQLGQGHSRVEVVNYYLYQGPESELQFDSALVAGPSVSEAQKPREAYCVVVQGISHGCGAAKAATRVPVEGTVKASTASVQANVDPQGFPTTYAIEYGVDESYGQTTATTELPNELGEQTATVDLSGLQPCTTYHYQAMAENEGNGGTPAVGGDQTFTTECGTILRFAGNGRTNERSGDGGPATSAAISEPLGLAVGSDGSVYIGENLHTVRKVNGSGVISTVAGMSNGFPSYTGDGGSATSARLGAMEGLAVSESGQLYIGDPNNQVVRRVEGGTISTFAGKRPVDNYESKSCPERDDLYSGDGGPASQAGFGEPSGVALGPDGSLYVVDGGDEVVRKVAPDGTISTVAGAFEASQLGFIEYFTFSTPHKLVCFFAFYSGQALYSGDGGAATSAKLGGPHGIAVGPDGSVYVAEFVNDVVRKISPGGTITTLAGDGSVGYSGDGGPATSAQLDSPEGVAVGSDGSVYIADTCNSVIRRVAPDGTITTIAGDGTPGRDGYGGLPTLAELNGPRALAIDGAGNLYTSVEGEVAEITQPFGPGSTEDEGGDTCGGGGEGVS